MIVERPTRLDELVSTIEWEGKEHRSSCSLSAGMFPSVAIDSMSIDRVDLLAGLPRPSNRSFDRWTEKHLKVIDSLVASLMSVLTDIVHRFSSQSYSMFLARKWDQCRSFASKIDHR